MSEEKEVQMMTFEIVITVVDERIAKLCAKKIEHMLGYNCEICNVEYDQWKRDHRVL